MRRGAVVADRRRLAAPTAGDVAPARISQVPPISIIVPVLDDARALADGLSRLAALRGAGHEVVVVDGGSADASRAVAAAGADLVLESAPGRAVQMNAGARAASHDRLLFLHADTRLPAAADRLIANALAEHEWGRFDVRLSGEGVGLRVVERAMNVRSRLTGIATGDQAIFVRREAFEAVGGYPPLALMEDVSLSTRLRARSRPACLRARVVTSSRRWERDGVLRTVGLMWALRLAFFAGIDTGRLARLYGRRPRGG